MRKVKGISYDTEKDSHIIAHIDRQQNGSKYVLELVRKDMQKEDKELEKFIVEKIEDYLKDIDLAQLDKKTSDKFEVDTSGIADILSIN